MNNNPNSDTNYPIFYKKIVFLFWGIFIAGILSIICLFWGLSLSKLPSFEELENPPYYQASEIFTENNEILGRYFVENRILFPYENISPHVIKALIATEDERYYQHAGIDKKALLRSIIKTGIFRDKSAGGGSTISQQLAKLLFTDDPSKSTFKRIIQKLKEWIIAVRLERKYTKEEIIAMYLNKFEFIYEAHGIHAAAETYFNKTATTLNQEEAATLVGMLKNPIYYNPILNFDKSKNRRNVVLQQMLKNKVLTASTCDSLQALPLDISKFKSKTYNSGIAPYFRIVLKEQLKHILEIDTLKRADGSTYDLHRDGLKIFTTIDAQIQAHHEAAMLQHMKAQQATYDEHWKGQDEWTYGNPIEVLQRKHILEKKIIASDRFISLIPPHLDSMMILAKQDSLLAVFKNLDAVKMSVFDYRKDQSFQKEVKMTPLDSIKYYEHFLQVGSIAIDPETAHVKSWVGGINHNYFQYDHITSNRQVGSTFKPFIYAIAIELLGLSPCDQIDDIPTTIHKDEGMFHLAQDWTPQNADATYSYESLSLFSALKKSVNTVSANLMKRMGSVKPSIQFVQAMGLDSTKIPPYPSICLGAVDLSVLEMTAAYSTFANNGLYSKPIFIKKIQDKYGRIIYRTPHQPKRALPPSTNYTIVQMLDTIVDKNTPLFADIESQIGGKTGTTNDFVDAWFMGITPDLVVGTWVGGNYPWIRFRDIEYGQGAKMARPLFADFIHRLESDSTINYDKTAQFKIPIDATIWDCHEEQSYEIKTLY